MLGNVKECHQESGQEKGIQADQIDSSKSVTCWNCVEQSDSRQHYNKNVKVQRRYRRVSSIPQIAEDDL